MNDTIGKGQPLPPPAATSSAGTSASSAPPGTVRIPSTQILPQTTAPLNVGDILRFHVRSNPPGEAGTLYYQGQLIKTALPSNINVGDRLLARLETTGDQVVFKILEQIKSDGSKTLSKANAAVANQITSNTQSARNDAPLQELTRQIQSVLDRTAAPQNDAVSQTPRDPLSRGILSAQTPLPIEEPLRSGDLQKLVDTVAQTIGKGEQLGDAAKVSQRIQLSASGTASEILRQAADAIKQVLKETPYQLPTTDRFLVLLQSQLSSVLDSLRSNPGREIGGKQVDVLLHALNEELKLQKGSSSKKAADVLKLVLTDLKQGKQDPATLEKRLEAALTRVANHLGSVPEAEGDKRVDPKVVSDLRSLVNRLESLAQTHETLAALNPVMTALGEPALILFPFILQGLLHHSEISIDPNAHRDPKGKDGKGKKGELDETYQRIQLRLPLPNLGPLEVDIAHRESEVLTRVIARDEKTAAFLLEQSENLRLSLQNAEFELVDYSTTHNREDSKGKFDPEIA